MLEPPKGFWLLWLPLVVGIWLITFYVLTFTGVQQIPVDSLPAYCWFLVVGSVGISLVGVVFRGPFGGKLQPSALRSTAFLLFGLWWTFWLPSNPYAGGGSLLLRIAIGTTVTLVGMISLIYTLRSR